MIPPAPQIRRRAAFDITLTGGNPADVVLEAVALAEARRQHISPRRWATARPRS